MATPLLATKLYVPQPGPSTIVPEFLWEASFGIWLTVKGFSASARILTAPTIATQPVAAD